MYFNYIKICKTKALRELTNIYCMYLNFGNGALTFKGNSTVQYELNKLI